MSTWFAGLETAGSDEAGRSGTDARALSALERVFADPSGTGPAAVATANTAYRSALRTTASLRQRSLLDFLR